MRETHDGRIDFFDLTRVAYDQLMDELMMYRSQTPHDQVKALWKSIQASYGKGTSSRFKTAIRQATQRGHAWSIDPDVYERLVSQPCYLCGGSTGNATGLDRQDTKQGYTVDNVQPCCGNCNIERQRSSRRFFVRA